MVCLVKAEVPLLLPLFADCCCQGFQETVCVFDGSHKQTAGYGFQERSVGVVTLLSPRIIPSHIYHLSLCNDEQLLLFSTVVNLSRK